jgi:hypothetical protein
LNDAALPKDKQASSETMTAIVLLNHYFAELTKLGLRTRGSPGIVVGEIQLATKEWFQDPDHSISVQGTVFVSPESKKAIVIGTVRERLAKQ